jgi:predicted nucleic acid-binding protein
VSNALHRYVVHGALLPEEAAELLSAALGLRITLFGHPALHRRALLLAGQFSLPSAYDAHYLAVAEVFGAEFWTADRRLFQAVGDTLPWVHSIHDQVSQGR